MLLDHYLKEPINVSILNEQNTDIKMSNPISNDMNIQSN